MEQQKVWDPLRKKAVALTPEEKVRQWFIGVLKERMKVPEYMMMSEVAMKFGGKDFRADILVYGRDTAPLMVVECKREDVTMSREVLEQALRYNLVLNPSSSTAASAALPAPPDPMTAAVPGAYFSSRAFTPR